MSDPKYRIAVLPGDGIGGEVMAEALEVLGAVADGFAFEFTEFSVGAGEYLRNGDPLPAATVEAVRSYDAILLGAMGLPEVRWPNGTEMTPQIDIREILDLYLGLRPIKLLDASLTPLKGYEAGAIDFLLIRENTEGLFWSRKNPRPAEVEEVEDVMHISRFRSERLFHRAFAEARKRRYKVTLVDKANVLPSMAFFRRVFDEVAAQYPDVATERVYVDAMAMYLLTRPERYDVIVTENMFGDILSDEAAGLIGGLGYAPSADLGDRYAVFQPSHGTAPDIAGQGIANPAAMILSAAMMLEWLGQPAAAQRIEAAVARAAAQSLTGTAAIRKAIVASL
ncbi:MAG: isocitrate/isopropylmalate dehydrogenase family protein [Bryobacteraceae bacterium]|nr:isocitrate/isopropylmalate dehydrogenase family protein [Bryobacteraceae bacterium]